MVRAATDLLRSLFQFCVMLRADQVELSAAPSVPPRLRPFLAVIGAQYGPEFTISCPALARLVPGRRGKRREKWDGPGSVTDALNY